MRSGELFALTWKDVDFDNRLLNVNKSHNCRLKVMKIRGWKELKTMQHYIRLAGIEIQGAPEAIRVLPFRLIPQEAAL
jgi:hypothetical protein